VDGTFRRLEREVESRLAEQGLPFARIELRREVDVRYTLQLAEVATPVAGGELSDEGVARIGADFEALYERLYGKGAGFREAGLQLITYRVFGVGHLPFEPELPRIASANGSQPALKGTRRVFLSPEHGFEETLIYGYESLAAG